LTDNKPGDDQLSTAPETRGSSQAVDCSIRAVPAGGRAKESWSWLLRAATPHLAGCSSRSDCPAHPVRPYGGHGRRKANPAW